MRLAPILGLILVLLTVFYGFAFASSTVCVECEAFADAPAANIVYSLDNIQKTLTVTLFYEDPGGSPSRKAINNTVVIIELTNSTGLKEVYKVYSNDNGTATFNFVSWGDRCTDMKMLYCPFCNPNSSSCGFAECMAYARIHNESGYYTNTPGPIASILDIPEGPGAGSEPSPYNPNLYFPAIKIAAYCPPPPPLTTTPALCLPLLIIFSLLSGALYLTGRNPFAGFNIGGARVGRHIRYQARGRGFSFSAMAAVSAIQTVAGAVKTVKQGGAKALAKQESRAAGERIFLVSQAKATIGGAKGLAAAARASKGKGAAGFGRAAGAMAGRFRDREVHGKGGEDSRGPGAGRTVAGAGGALTFEAGGAGGVRGADLAVFSDKGVGGYFGDLGVNILRISTFVLTQTTLGRVVDGFYSLATNKSIFESIFVKQSERLAGDLEVMGWIRAENGRGARVSTGGEGEVVVRDFRETHNAAGAVDGYAVTIDAPQGTERGQTADGQMTITFNKDGTIREMSFMMAGVAGAGTVSAENPQGLGNGRIIVLPREAEGGDIRMFIERPGATAGAEPTREAILRDSPMHDFAYTAQALSVPSDIRGAMFGGNATDFINNCKSTQEAISAMTATVQADIYARRLELAEAMERMSREPDSREIIRDARYDDATRAWEGALGADPGSFRIGGDAGVFTGVSETRSDYGERGAHVVAATGVNEAFVSAFGSRDLRSYVHDVTQSLPEGDRGRVADAMVAVLSRMSPAEISTMSNADFRSALASHMGGGGAPGSGGVTEATRIAAAIPESTFSGTRSAMTDFRTELTDRLPAALATRLWGAEAPGGVPTSGGGGTVAAPGADMSMIVGLSDSGRRVSDPSLRNPDTLPELLERHPDAMSRLPDDLATDMRMYRSLGSMNASVGNVDRAMSSGGPPGPGSEGNFADAMRVYGSEYRPDSLMGQHATYWEGGLTATAARYGGFTEQEADMATRGVDMRMEADRVREAQTLALGGARDYDARFSQLSVSVASGDLPTAMAGYQTMRDSFQIQLDATDRHIAQLNGIMAREQPGGWDYQQAEASLIGVRETRTQLATAVGSCDGAIGTVRNLQGMDRSALDPTGYGMMMGALPGSPTAGTPIRTDVLSVGVTAPGELSIGQGDARQRTRSLTGSLELFSDRNLQNAADGAEVRFELQKPRPTGGI